jgi:N-acylglucosamine-6-phosphate 2-epimerase
MKERAKIIESLRGGLIVSCQLHKTDPEYVDGIIPGLAKAAVWGGACAVRIDDPENIVAVRKAVDVPIIGLWKKMSRETEVFMTPDLPSVAAVLQAGADIVAVDGTDRPIGGRRGCDLIPEIRRDFPQAIIFADCRDEKDAALALSLGADFVAPTFYRFGKNAVSTDLPDWKMFARMCRIAGDKAVMEGKIWTPDDAVKAFHYGAYAVVVGTAITRPHLVAQRFYDVIHGYPEERSLFY